MSDINVVLEQPAIELPPCITETLILEDILIETIAVDGICGVY